jgi:uncharacterized membrane protein
VTTTPADPAETLSEIEKTSAERAIFFTDAVIAIAITLLALELPVWHGDSVGDAWSSFGASWEEYLAFLVSFVVIGNLWLNHHADFRYVNRVSRRLAQLNLLWLLTIVVTPFVTKGLVLEDSFPMAFTLYCLVQAAGTLVFMLMIRMIRRQNFAAQETPEGFYEGVQFRSLAFLIGFLASIPVSFVTHWAYAVWWVVPQLIGLVRRRLGSPARGR